MVQYNFHSQGARGGRRRLAYATLLILAIFLLDLISGGGIRAIVQSGTSSLWRASERVRAGIFDSGYLRTRRSLAKENVTLKEQIAKNAEKAAAYEAAQEENELLRALLRLTQQESGITAPIVSSVRSSPYGTFLIGAGESDGITAGNIVITEGGFVVGRVRDVRERTTLVTEVFAGGEEVDAMIGGAVAPAEGRGGGNAIVLMPRGIQIEEGDPVVAPQLGGRPIGIVGKVESDTSSAEQTVYISLPVNLSSLRYVYIVPVQ